VIRSWDEIIGLQIIEQRQQNMDNTETAQICAKYVHCVSKNA